MSAILTPAEHVRAPRLAAWFVAMFRAIAGKELRETLPWAALCLAVLSIGVGFGVVHALPGNGMDADMFNNAWSNITATFSLGGPLVALLLGLRQTMPELRRDLWAFLVHRPVSHGLLFAGKAVVGISLYLVVTTLPLLGAALWAKAPGHLAGPFDWRLTLGGIAGILAGLPFYFGGMLVGLRPARWWGSRVIPPAAACGIAFIAALVPEFWVATVTALVATAIFATAAYGSFLTAGEYHGQKLQGKTALGIILYLGLAIIGLCLTVLGGSAYEAVQSHAQTAVAGNYAITDSGQIIEDTSSGDGQKIYHIRLLYGPLVRRGPHRSEVDYADTMYGQSISIGRSADYEAYGDQYTDPERYMVDIPTSRFGQVDYYSQQQCQIITYDTHTRAQIGVTGPNGFRPGAGIGAGKFPEALINIVPNGNYVGIGDDFLVYRSLIYLYNPVTQAITLDPIHFTNSKVNIGESVWLSGCVIVTNQDLDVFSDEGALLLSIPIPRIAALSSKIQVATASPDHRILVWLRDKHDDDRGGQIWVYGKGGALLKRVVLQPLPTPAEPSASSQAVSSAIGYVFPPIFDVVAIAILLVTHHVRDVSASVSAGLLLKFGTVTLLRGLFAALIAFAIGRRCAYSKSGLIAWSIGAFFFGWTDVLMLIALREWPARVACPNCGRKRVVTREECEHCGAPFAAPLRNGTEIFEGQTASATGEFTIPSSSQHPDATSGVVPNRHFARLTAPYSRLSAGQAMFFKELRANLPWAVSSLAGLVVGLVFAVLHARIASAMFGDADGGMSPTLFVDAWNAITSALTFGGPMIGLLLGLLQIMPEQRRDQWAFLIHRPMRRRTLFLTKSAAGLLLYTLATGLPLLGTALWAKSPGHLAAPFDWRMALGGLAGILIGVPFYFGGMLVALRPARWWGSRAVPLVTTIGVAALAMQQLQFWQAAMVATLSAVVFAVAAHGSFQSAGEYTSQSRIGRAALGAVLYAGKIIILFAVMAAGYIFAKAVFPVPLAVTTNTRYAVTEEGQIMKLTVSSLSATANIHTLDGTPVLHGPRESAFTMADVLPFQPLDGQQLWNAHQFAASFSDPERYALNIPYDMLLDRIPTDDDYSRKLHQIIIYNFRTGLQVGVGGPHGFRSGTGIGAGRFPRSLIAVILVHSKLSDEPSHFWHVALVYPQRVYLYNPRTVELSSVTAHLSSNLIQHASTINGADSQDFYGVTDHAIEYFSARGELLCTLPLPRLNGSDGNVQISSSFDGKRLYLWSGAGESDNGGQIWEYTSGGVLVRHVLLPQLLLTDAPAPANSADLGVILKAILQRHRTLLLRSAIWDAILSALLAFAIGRRCAFSKPGLWAWTIGVFWLGLPGVLLLLSLRDWPARELCPNCGRRRVLTRELCEHCGAPFVEVEADGTEIWQRDTLREAATVAS